MHKDAAVPPSDILKNLSYEKYVNFRVLLASASCIFLSNWLYYTQFQTVWPRACPGLPKPGLEEITMKTFNTVMKVLAVLAAVAGVIYVIAAFGDKIVAWAKRVIGCCPWDEGMEETKEPASSEEAPAEETAPAAEEAAAPEAAPAEEAPAEEPKAAAEDNAPVASEEDFEG